MHLLRSRSFLLLFLGQALNGIGSWAALVAMWGFAAYQFDSGPAQIALLGLAWAVPSAIVGPFAGVPIDRFGAKRVLILAYVASAATATAMSFVDSYRELVALGVLLGLAKAFAMPASDTLPPRLVDDDDLLAANALLGASSESAIVFGPLVAALAIAAWGLRGAFIVDAATYLIGIAVVAPLVLRTPSNHDGEAPSGNLRRDLREGFALVARQPVLRFTLLLSSIVFVTWSTFVVVEPIYVRDVLGQPASFFALLQTAFGIGLVGTGLLLPRLGDRVAGPRALSLSVVLSGLTAAVYVGTRIPAVAVAGVFLWGVDVAFFSAPSRTLLQRNSPPSTHGRVLALYRTVHSGADVIALPLAGLAAGVAGVQSTALAVATLPFLAGIVGFRFAARFSAAEQDPDLVEPVRLESPVA
ncbi:MAG: MFS transporter [Actinomycetota bacterium]|nr:MFS transporter [Actinomycetota bacterium]